MEFETTMHIFDSLGQVLILVTIGACGVPKFCSQNGLVSSTFVRIECDILGIPSKVATTPLKFSYPPVSNDKK